MYHKHYIKCDERGRIIDTWSDGPLYNRDITGAVCINEQGEYQFRFSPDGEENPFIFTDEGVPMYTWDGESVVKRSEEEIAADTEALLNSPEVRANEIKLLLTELDSQAIRPLRAILTGTPSDEDRNRLSEIETRAVALRTELATLEGVD